MNLTYSNECIAALLDKGVAKQTKISGGKGEYVSVNKDGTATFNLRYTDKRPDAVNPQPTHELGKWVPGVFGVGEAGVEAAIWRKNIKNGIYPSKAAALHGHGITFPKLVE